MPPGGLDEEEGGLDEPGELCEGLGIPGELGLGIPDELGLGVLGELELGELGGLDELGLGMLGLGMLGELGGGELLLEEQPARSRQQMAPSAAT